MTRARWGSTWHRWLIPAFQIFEMVFGFLAVKMMALHRDSLMSPACRTENTQSRSAPSIGAHRLGKPTRIRAALTVRSTRSDDSSGRRAGRMALCPGFDAQHIVGGIEAGTSIDVMRQTQMAAGLFLLGFSSSEKMPPFLKAPGSHAKSAAEASLACYP